MLGLSRGAASFQGEGAFVPPPLPNETLVMLKRLFTELISFLFMETIDILLYKPFDLTPQMFAGSKDFVGLVLFGTPGSFIDTIIVGFKLTPKVVLK